MAKLLRAGELTAVWVPDEKHEAMRDLVRAREGAAQDLTRKRQQVTAFLLRHGRTYPRKKTWGATHARWLTEQVFQLAPQRIAFEELVMAVRQAKERVSRLDEAIAEFAPHWSMAPLVEALQAMRGIDLVAAAVLLAELGDLRRFDNPRRLMGYLGLVPSERSTGATVRRGAITKSGNIRARRILIESAWTYRHPPRLSTRKRFLFDRAPRTVREIAWKAQTRLSARTRALTGKAKRSTIVTAAIARELAGFIWAIGQEVAPAQ
jgi:transposase